MTRFTTPKSLFALGILLRIVVFWFLGPTGPDHHLSAVQFTADHGRTPLMSEHYLAFHPPLYYWLAAAIWKATGTAKAVQALSLVISIATLAIFYLLLYRTSLVKDQRAQFLSWLLVCFQPQFVIFSLLVSNDTLTIFWGALAILAFARYAQTRRLPSLVYLALVTGLGLTTKATFLSYAPIFLLVTVFVSARSGDVRSRVFATAAIFASLTLIFGSYKYVDNYQRYRQPFITNMDLQELDWMKYQRTSYRGAASFLDFNLAHLIARPVIDPDLEGSYPLLLYGTTWYPTLVDDSLMRHWQIRSLGSLTYLAALIPTIVCLLGLGLILARAPARFVASALDVNYTLSFVSALCAIASIFILISTAAKYHVFTVMHGRLLFPAFAGFLAAFGEGYAWVARKGPGMERLITLSVIGIVVLSLAFFASQIAFLMLEPMFPNLRSIANAL